jgi:hypothetical protein
LFNCIGTSVRSSGSIIHSNTSNITRIDFFRGSSQTFAAGTKLVVYGIKII